jgi:hypothetical protein
MPSLSAPPIELGVVKLRAFERLYDEAIASGGLIHYELSYPKYEFLSFVVLRHDTLLHGTADGSIDVFEPALQTDYFGRLRRGVFAASDGIWPMFFAIIDWRVYRGSLRNACLWESDASGRREKRYAFSINAVMLPRRPWRNGVIYILPRASFERVVSDEGTPSEEWCSLTPVRPLAHIPVHPDDFPFLDQIEGHGDEQWHRWEELAYELAVGAADTTELEDGFELSFADGQNWNAPATAFRDLSNELVPQLGVEVIQADPDLRVRMTGSKQRVRQLVAAFARWRATLQRDEGF